VLGSVIGYFFSIITVFAAGLTFMALLIGVFGNSTFEKFRHYPRPIIERTVTPAPPNKELYLYVPNQKSKVALRTNEATTLSDSSAPDKNTNDSRAASSAKGDAKNRKPERKIKPERLAHLRQPKVLARQRPNYDGHGYATALGYAEGRSALEDLNGQR
jgi:hypothetical protein